MKSEVVKVVVLALWVAGCGVQTEEEPFGAAGSAGHGHAGSGGSGASSSGEQIVDAPDAQAWVHLELGSAPLGAAPADPLGWDLRVARTALGTNSGTSGPGNAGAVATEHTSIGEDITCPADGYAVDTMLPMPGPPGSGEFSGNPVLNDWYNYDPATHAVTTKGAVYCIRTADDHFGAIRIKNYASGQMTLEWRVLPEASESP